MGSSASRESRSATVRSAPRHQQSHITGRESRSAARTSPNHAQHTSKADKPINNNKDVLYGGAGADSVQTTLSNTAFEQVFLITTGKAAGAALPCRCMLVPDMAKKAKLLSSTNIDEAVFERLLMARHDYKLVHNKARISDQSPVSTKLVADEPFVFKYIYHCYVRWKSVKADSYYSDAAGDTDLCKTVIFQQVQSCLQQPEMFKNQNIHKQFIDLCIESKDSLLDKASKIHEFVMESAAIMESKRGCIEECLVPVLALIKEQLRANDRLMHAVEVSQLTNIVKLFTRTESLAKLLMKFTAPNDWSLATSYEDSLLGVLLAMNPCPRSLDGPHEFFMDAVESSPQSVHTTIMYIWQRLNDICDDVHKILIGVCRLTPALRHAVLKWLGKCIEANRKKTELWSAHEAEVFQSSYCTDGFCLNLCHVMLKMCLPFAVPDSEKLFKIKASYCRYVPKSDEQMQTASVHAGGLHTETTMVPYTDAMLIEPDTSYHFISECFFLTHQILHIGYSIVYKIIKLNGSISRLRRIHQEIKDIYPKRVVDLVKNQLRKEICLYLNMKAAVTEYQISKMCLHFNIATASWLVQVATRDDVTQFLPIKFPLPDQVPKSLAYLPEFIVTNMTIFISSLEIFRGMDLLTSDDNLLQHYANFILVFMGSPDRLVNADVRAKLAVSLEAIVPALNDSGTYVPSTSGHAERLFTDHPLISHLSERLLNVFVSIEMTGQNVDDEKKFNYRKSMHLILQYIWTIPLHKEALKSLADQALSEMENSDPPLFLRFINLLTNDAIFLLDEALDHMKQIRVQELEREDGQWNSLSAEQMRDKETGLRNLAMMGHYRNIMANHTIYTLERIAREIKAIFCHDMMVDRIAGMLNYFLEHLVGPKQKDYKVKDRHEHEFKPEQIVSDICHIYVYLGTDDRFCRAVLGETRSFSHKLFDQTIIVLNKIGISTSFQAKFEDLNNKLKNLEVEKQQEDDMMSEAPEEFLDPIMGTLMQEPVTLPSSNTNIDKAVIARHLLSDQRDPFTNILLSMDMVIPNTELKERIEQWKKGQIQKEV